MNVLEEDAIELIKALFIHEVSYLLVGGIAVIYYGYGRTTGDVDIWLEDSPSNRKKLVAALSDYGIEGAEAFNNLPLIAGYSEIMLDSGIYLDLMTNLTQFPQSDFKACYALSEDWEPVEGIHVRVLHLNQLIQEKEHNHRLKDKDDVAQLKKVRNQNKEKNGREE